MVPSLDLGTEFTRYGVVALGYLTPLALHSIAHGAEVVPLEVRHRTLVIDHFEQVVGVNSILLGREDGRHAIHSRHFQKTREGNLVWIRLRR